MNTDFEGGLTDILGQKRDIWIQLKGWNAQDHKELGKGPLE